MTFDLFTQERELTCPAWVLDRLVREGLPAERGRGVVTTHRRVRAVPRWHDCGQPVYTGIAWPWQVVADPTPTTPDGELFAILTGRTTVHIDLHGEMQDRSDRMEFLSADVERVYIAHSCDGPFPIVNDKWKPAVTDYSVIPF